MKKSILSVIVLTAALMISCVKSEEPIVEDGYTFRFEISGENDADAKSTMNGNCLSWEKDDVLDFVLEVDGTADWYQRTKIDVVDPRPSFSFTSNSADDRELKEGTRIFCCYPRITNSSNRESLSNSSSQYITLPLVQTHKGGEFSGRNMPMVSVPFTFTSDVIEKRVGQMKFLNLGAMLEFKVFSLNGAHSDETVQDVIFEADKNIAGTFKFDLQNVNPANDETLAIDLSAAQTNNKGECPLSKMIRTESDAKVGSSKDDAGSVRMVVAPGTYTGKVKVRTDKAYYVFNVTNKAFARNGHYPLGLDLSGSTCVRTVMTRMDQTKWEARFCNSSQNDSGAHSANWGYQAINDGKLTTAWQNATWRTAVGDRDDIDYTIYDNTGIALCYRRRDIPNVVMVMDMKESVNVARIGIGVMWSLDWPYNQTMKTCEFYVADEFTFTPLKYGGNLSNYNNANDKNDWGDPILTATLPHENGGVYWFDVPSTVSEAARTGQYIKIHPTDSYREGYTQFCEIYLDYVPTTEVSVEN